MAKIVIFGNAGAGKSTLARFYRDCQGLPYLDLDAIAWRSDQPHLRLPLQQSVAKIQAFISTHPHWVIEGCYGSLLPVAISYCDRLIFLNPGMATCEKNCQQRQWEPHKYASPSEQDQHLNGLLDWVRQYEIREDEFSYGVHRQLFEGFSGNKQELRSNESVQYWQRFMSG
ncbi:MAG: shikimate kinase [Chloroflexaceae bacterium]|nr:shikimate kinase [Chloroflexaceae bacterium]